LDLLCTVRNCRQPLVRDGRIVICANKHSFDVARSGYVNLLQPQDKKSKSPGDTPEAVNARRRFFERGFEAPIVEGVIRALPMHDAVLDVGCGEGRYLGALGQGTGVDISVPAIDLAARTYPQCTWIVANADRFLPFPDASFASVMSITARMNADEFHRVLRDDGTLLVVLPAADDVIELREAVLGERIERDRTERTIASFAPLFVLEHRETLRHTATLDHDAMFDVMASSYRGLRTREREKLDQAEAMRVTLSRDVLRFRRAGTSG
jgi:23S rRNA (guanine745-N1)-methyltransferase